VDLIIENLQDDIKPILENTDYLTAFLCGSKSMNLSHALSDTDIWILSESNDTEKMKYEGCEVKIVVLSDLNEAIESALNGERLSVFSQVLLSNVYHGIPIIKADVFDDINQKIPWDLIIRNMISDRLRGYKFYKQDAYKFKDIEEMLSARFCYQRAIDNLIDAYLFCNGLLIVKDKWRLKSFEKQNNALFNEFIAMYLDIWSSNDLESFSKKFDKTCGGIFELINTFEK